MENKIKYRTNEQGVFFYVVSLELDVFYKVHDILFKLSNPGLFVIYFSYFRTFLEKYCCIKNLAVVVVKWVPTLLPLPIGIKKWDYLFFFCTGTWRHNRATETSNNRQQSPTSVVLFFCEEIFPFAFPSCGQLLLLLESTKNNLR